MSAIKTIQEQVEEMGVYFEKTGLTPIHGRVWAYLLLADPPYKDFYEIQEFLQASKSAISNALKHLENQGVIDYVTFSGDRRRYFRINVDGWMANYKSKVRQITDLNELVKKVLETRAGSDHQDFNRKLEKMVNFQTYLAAGIEDLIETWERENGDL
jgi:DNA-binding transcriptional regulator GbsR (MarR family)